MIPKRKPSQFGLAVWEFYSLFGTTKMSVFWFPIDGLLKKR